MDCIYKIREARSEIINPNFTLPDLPAFDLNNAAGAGANADAVMDTWSSATVANIKSNYNKMLEVLKKLKVSMANIN